MQRFFVSRDAYRDNTVTIVGEDARHISFSLRMKKGETISVCLPDATLLTCVLESFGDDAVTARVVSEALCDTEPPYKARLYQALPKGDKLETIVQKAVECGVYEIIPFESSRCIAKWDRSPEKKLERLNRIALEAAKQCGRGYVPRVKSPLTFKQVVEEAAEADRALFCYEAGGEDLGRILLDGGDTIAVIIGAEGGFSLAEAEAAVKAGCESVGLGKRILRCETAPLCVLSDISYEFEL
jgi:16S rRNA (uracil1498-N3)-methyltransferase